MVWTLQAEHIAVKSRNRVIPETPGLLSLQINVSKESSDGFCFQSNGKALLQTWYLLLIHILIYIFN